MNTYKYICTLLNMNELFKVRDAMSILDQYGFGDVYIMEIINAELERRTQ